MGSLVQERILTLSGGWLQFLESPSRHKEKAAPTQWAGRDGHHLLQNTDYSVKGSPHSWGRENETLKPLHGFILTFQVNIWGVAVAIGRRLCDRKSRRSKSGELSLCTKTGFIEVNSHTCTNTHVMVCRWFMNVTSRQSTRLILSNDYILINLKANERGSREA